MLLGITKTASRDNKEEPCPKSRNLKTLSSPKPKKPTETLPTVFTEVASFTKQKVSI
jgi:hypothetical protein